MKVSNKQLEEWYAFGRDFNSRLSGYSRKAGARFKNHVWEVFDIYHRLYGQDYYNSWEVNMKNFIRFKKKSFYDY